jgi:hypothetical protein
MNRPSHRLTLGLTLCALSALLLAPSARADCVDGVRDATKAELEFAARAHAALVAGLPALPSPIIRQGAPRDPLERVRLSFCRGQAVGDFDVGVSEGSRYEFTPAEANDRSQRRRDLLRQIEQIEQLPPEKEAQRKALLDQARAAYDAAPRRGRKDPPFTPEQQALADKQSAEGRRFEDAARQVESDHRASVRAQTAPLRSQADELQQGPQMLSVSLRMNTTSFPQAGANAEVVTFGTPSAKRSAGLVVHNIVVTVGGPDGPARRALLEAVDRNYLQSLIGKAPPEVAASQARIAAVAAAAPPPAVQPSVGVAAAAAPAAATAGAAAAAAAAARPATTPAAAPAAPPPPREEQKKAEPSTTAQDAANAVNKLRGLLGR